MKMWHLSSSWVTCGVGIPGLKPIPTVPRAGIVAAWACLVLWLRTGLLPKPTLWSQLLTRISALGAATSAASP